MSEKRIWNPGPPPHVGWWNASVQITSEGLCKWDGFGELNCWRWWNGTEWSQAAWESHSAMAAGSVAGRRWGQWGSSDRPIFWTDYWPENARVPRIDPRPKAPATPAAAPTVAEKRRPATKRELLLARSQYEQGSDNDIEIDDDAVVSDDPETDNIWVQAWVYVRK